MTPTKLFLLFIVFVCLSASITSAADSSDSATEENEIVELKSEAENICIDQEEQSTIINITFIQTQVSS